MTAPAPTTSIPVTMFDDVVEWNQRRTDASRWTVQPRSALSGDDKWADPYYVSHAALHRLHSAIDHLHAVKLLLVDAATLPTFAVFTLIRAGMENAASVTWLLQPAARHHRVLRRLQMAASNAKSADSAIALMQQNAGPEGRAQVTPLDEILDRVRRAGAAHGISQTDVTKKLSGWADIVRAASTNPRLGNTEQFLWRMCSALAHADEWPTLALLASEEGEADGIVSLKVEAPMQLAMTSFELAVRMVGRALAVYDARRRPLY